MIRVFLMSFLLSSGVLYQAQAQETVQMPKVDAQREAEVAMKAKKRLYPGGRDEEDLRVQSQLTTPVRKMAPQADVREETVEE